MITPILRIFDYDKAIEFYVGYLGFQIDWEHTFHDNAPIYLQISKGDLKLHLSEHYGDGTPGTKILIEYKGLKAYHKELKTKNYKYLNPGITKAPWKSKCMNLIDPFGNKLNFNESES